MRTRRRIWGMLLCIAVPACSLDCSMAERDDGGTADVDAEPDGDVAADADADADGDVGPDGTDADTDDAAGPDADADADTGGGVLNAAGFATVAGEGLASGSMRLLDLGFEGTGRSCADSLCLWTGVML